MAAEKAGERIDVGGHALGVIVSGNGSRCFLCLHGLVDRIAIWDRLEPHLARLGRVVRIDQRGHGASDAPPGPYSLGDLARDAVAVLDRLGIASAVFVGHSMGGVVSMTAAIEHPERVSGLVLLGTASQSSARVVEWYETIARAGEENGIDGLRRAIYGERSNREIRGDAAGIARVTRALATLHERPLTPRLAAVTCPALALVGERDPMGPKASAIVASVLPRATLEVFAGRGHWLHVEAPEDVARAIEGMLHLF